MKKIAYMLLLLFFIQFGYINQGFVEITVLPFTNTYQMPIIVFTFFVFAFALIFSWCYYYFSLRSIKKQLKNLT